MKVYYAKYVYTFPVMIEFDVEKKTPKRVYLKPGSRKFLIGDSISYYQTYLDKSNEYLFWSPIDALTYLVNEGTKQVKHAERRLEIAKDNLASLVKELKDAISNQPTE